MEKWLRIVDPEGIHWLTERSFFELDEGEEER